MYIYKLDYIVNKYNNTKHSTIKIKPVDVKSNTYINSSKEVNNKDPKFNIDDIIRISKYKKFFAKGYTPNWSEEVFVIKRVKNTVLLMILIRKNLLKLFMKKNCKEQMKKSLELKKQSKEKVISYMLHGRIQ